MPINKTNLYDASTERNLTNLTVNVDYDRLNEDKTEVSVNYGTIPATVSIKVGSIIEVNGNRYIVQTTDEDFQMANATHNYITVTDDGGTDADPLTFSSASTIGTFSATKQGYYQTDDVTKTLKYYIDQSNETDLLLLDVLNSNQINTTKVFDRMKVYLGSNQSATGVMQLDSIVVDELSRWDTVNYQYIAVESGYYFLSAQMSILTSSFTSFIRVDSGSGPVNVSAITWAFSTSATRTASTTTLEYLNKGDIVDCYYGGSGTLLAGSTLTYLSVARLL